MNRRRFGLGSRDTRRGRASEFLYILSFAPEPRPRRRCGRPRRPHPTLGSSGVRLHRTASSEIAAPNIMTNVLREREDA